MESLHMRHPFELFPETSKAPTGTSQPSVSQCNLRLSRVLFIEAAKVVDRPRH